MCCCGLLDHQLNYVQASDFPGVMSEEILEFPCSYEIRAFGRAETDLATLVKDLVLQHTPASDILGCDARPSRKARYLVVRCTVLARNREHLLAIYTSFQQSEQVLTVL